MKTVIYSKITLYKFIEYCDNNLPYPKGEVGKAYLTEKVLCFLFQILWLAVNGRLAILIMESMKNYFVYTRDNSFEYMSLCMAVVSITVFSIAKSKSIAEKLLPTCRMVDKGIEFRIKVEKYIFPLFELQEDLRNGIVKSISLEKKYDVIAVRYNDSYGADCERYYLYGGYEAYVKDNQFDFTCIDDMINRCAKEAGLKQVV